MNYTTQPQNKTPQWFVITWLIILLFFFVWKAVSQDRKDLPILNQRILHYVDSVEGTKIKNGVCRHFIMQAINYALPVRIKWGRKSNPENFLSWEGYNLPKEYALPGDIIYTSSHIGVIYEIDDSECIITAH